MTFSDYSNTLISHISGMLDEGITVTLNEVCKTNGVKKHGLVIRGEEVNIAPNIYIDGYYREDMDFEDAVRVASIIVDCYNREKLGGNFDVTDITDFDKAKHNIVARLVGADSNEELLGRAVHVKYLDFALVLHVCVSTCGGQRGSVVLSEELAKNWDRDREELFLLAFDNMVRDYPHRLTPMKQLLEAMSEVPPELVSELDDDMYILTNSAGYMGAICMMYPGVLKEIYRSWGCEFYVLPSSLHEVILLKIHEGMSADYLSDIVKNVNLTAVDAEDILTDSVYRYSSDKNVLIKAK